MHVDLQLVKERIATHADLFARIRAEVAKVVVGQEQLVSRLLMALLADGHVLLEGLPGLAKTTLVKTLAQVFSTQFQRIQFTPDLLPADLIGTLIYNPRDGSFAPKKGPIFANIILADEINRAPSKVQSALLEAMQERQVTIGETTYRLDAPFLVLATQNPIEQEGTYPLPEAQVDRFLLKLLVHYPSANEEKEIVDRALNAIPREPKAVATPQELLAARQTLELIYIDDKLKSYVVDLARATREPKSYGLRDLEGRIEVGASPRASINLALMARAAAFLAGRGFVTPQDVKDVAADVLRHRILLTYEAEAEELRADDVVKQVLAGVAVP